MLGNVRIKDIVIILLYVSNNQILGKFEVALIIPEYSFY